MAFVYSCCFWFSLRLGGILIGTFSLASAVLYSCILAKSNLKSMNEALSNWISNIQLVYTKQYLEAVKNDPERYVTLMIVVSCIYIVLCCLYIYGAYTINTNLMVGFIMAECIRLLIISATVVTLLLVLKENTMDIGILIGASVVAGFALLGMFYLWVCAANLPIVINEMQLEKQEATIARLRQLLDDDHTRKSTSDDLLPTIDNAYY